MAKDSAPGNYNWPPQPKSSYIKSHLDFIKFAARNHHSLDIMDLSEEEGRVRSSLMNEQYREIIQYDINQDKIITYDELSQAKKKIGRCHLAWAGESYCEDIFVPIKDLPDYNEIIALDMNKDGQLTEDEMKSLLPRFLDKERGTRWREWKFIKSYLSLDPNHDGNLTLQELETRAEKTFDLYDIDGDENLSKQEIYPYAEYDGQFHFLWPIKCRKNNDHWRPFNCG